MAQDKLDFVWSRENVSPTCKCLAKLFEERKSREHKRSIKSQTEYKLTLKKGDLTWIVNANLIWQRSEGLAIWIWISKLIN